MRADIKNSHHQRGQALVSGLLLLVFTLFCSGYFLYVSEAHFRLFSNAQKANEKILKNTATIANTLNEIAVNNRQIVVSLATAENSFLQAMQPALAVGFHQPYWETYGVVKKSALTLGKNFLQPDVLSKDAQATIKQLFHSYALSSARGLFVAKALAAKNHELIHQLPLPLQSLFIQSSNEQALCFALETQNKLYSTPSHQLGLNPASYLYQFSLTREAKNPCALTHKRPAISKLFNPSLPVLYSQSSDRVVNYVSLSQLFDSPSLRYGISFVPEQKKHLFINLLSFESEEKVDTTDHTFIVIENYLSHYNSFKGIHLNEQKKLSANSLTNKFALTHKFLKSDDFLKVFFFANWTVTETDL